jgi:hypothetical protein
MGVPAATPRWYVLAFRSLQRPDAFAALALGFFLVGLALAVAFPLVALISGGSTALKRLLDIGSRHSRA